MDQENSMVDALAEIVGTVLEVNVSVGDSINSGSQLLLIESMKMEIPVLAPAAGSVSEVRVEVGEVVHESDLLVRVAPA